MSMNMRKIFYASGAAVILSFAGYGIASAAIPDSSGVIHGCYKPTSNGSLAPLGVVDTAGSGGTCPSNQTALTWNQTGPQGPAGATGPTGPAGPQGPRGPAGITSMSTETAQTAGFGLPGSPNEPYATATCPSGSVVTGGGIQPAQDGQVLATYPTSDGTGWYGQFYGGPAGGVGTVYVLCASLGS